MDNAPGKFAPLSDGELANGQAIAGLAQEDGALVSPVPADAPQPPQAHSKFGKPSAQWICRNASGAVLQIISRFDAAEGCKQFLPLTLWRDGAGLRWRWKGLPAPRPL